MSFNIGIDLGGTYIKYGLVSEVGEIIEKGKVPTPAGCGYVETAEVIVSAVRGLAKSGAPIGGLGIGAPGIVDGEKGIVRTSGNLGWENKPLAEDLSAKLGIPVTLANDANAAAYGEYACGAGKEYRSVVLLTLGTGVGSGIVLNGKLFEGNEGAGVELGKAEKKRFLPAHALAMAAKTADVARVAALDDAQCARWL